MTAEDRIDNLSEQHPCVGLLLANGEAVRNNSFLTDIREKLLKYGSLSPKQISAVDRSLTAAKSRSEALARGVAAPEGQCKVVGEIVSVKPTKWGHGITVRSEEGWAVWLTLPSSLKKAARDAESTRGRKVEFEATLERSDRDQLFAFAKRPSNATFLT